MAVDDDTTRLAFLWSCVVGLIALVATLVIGHLLERGGYRRLPTAGVGLLVGAACAGVASLNLVSSRLDEQIMADERFSFDFFVIWLLPPIIFEAGFNMDAPTFASNIGPTLFLAFVGTTISTGIVGGLVWYAGQLGLCYPLGLLASLTFGSIISATDPVTVLAVFQVIGVDGDLFSIIFGESVLNDAVAIVLSRMLLGFNSSHATVDATSILSAVAFFCIVGTRRIHTHAAWLAAPACCSPSGMENLRVVVVQLERTTPAPHPARGRTFLARWWSASSTACSHRC